MATFRRGLDAEDRICTKLEGFGCRLQRDPRLDHKHKLDFVITNYIDNPNFYSLGVQITTKLDLLEKQEEFLRANQASRVTTKALYLELSDRVDLDDGGALAVLSIILEFQFNRSYANIRLAAARVYDDMTFQFYDLPARVKQLRERFEEQQWRSEVTGFPAAASPATPKERFAVVGGAAAPAAVPGVSVPGPVAVPSAPVANFPGATLNPQRTPEVQGVIDSYVRQGGHGIIHSEGESRYFFHISHVADEGLREYLNALPYSSLPTNLSVAVDFTNAGFTKAGARYPEARAVKARR